MRKLKLFSLLLMLLVGLGQVWGYTITFSKGSGDGTSASTSTACSTIVSDGSSYLSGNLATATKVYYGGSDGLKLGTSSASGTIKMNLASNVTPTSIVVSAKRYNSSKAATLKVNGSTAQNITDIFSNLTFNLTSQISYIELEGSKYCWIESITVNTGTPQPTACAAPTFSPAEGAYTSAQSVTINCTTENSTIYYTTDGSDPTTSSSEYSSAISVSETTTIKAIAVAEEMDNSSVASATYTMLEHAGTSEDPYTVADARTAIDANVGLTSVYATGIVSAIVTEYSTQHSNISFNISIDGETTSNQLQAYRCGGENAADVAVGDIVVVSGNLTKYNSTYEFAQGCTLVSLTHPEVTDGVITAPATVQVPAAGTDEGSITISYTNIEAENVDDVALYTDADHQTLCGNNCWLAAEWTDETKNSISYLAEENTDTQARTAYIYLYALDNNENDVEKVIEVTQAGYVVDYATLPFEYDGNGTGELPAGLTVSGTGTYGSSPAIKLDHTGDYVIIKINEVPGTMTYDIKNNSFSGGTFTVQESEDGETYTTVAIYTSIEGTQNESKTLLQTTRYVKFIYTNKSSGNVGLGNIKIYAYVEPTDCETPTFTPEHGENFDESVDVALACATNGATIYYTLNGDEPTSSSTQYNAPITLTETTTIKAIAVKEGLNDSEIASATYTKTVTITSYDIDFENEITAYVNWDFTNIVRATTTISPKTGTYYANTDGKASASIISRATIANPGQLTFYTSKESTNTTSSSWVVKISEDGTDWSDIATFDATSGKKGDWTKREADLSEYTNVYVQIAYSGSTAVRAIDDISLEMASAVKKPSISGVTPFLSSTSVTLECTTVGATIYYTTDGSDPKTSETKQTYSEPFALNATTTVKVAAKLNDDWSAVVESTFTKGVVLTVAQALGAEPAANQYVEGVISGISEVSTEHGNATYTIKDANAENAMTIYRGKYLNNVNFTAENQILVGDEVTVFGQIEESSEVNRMASNNYIVAMYPLARMSWSGLVNNTFTADIDSENTFPTINKPEGVTVTYTSSDNTKAYINETTGAITLNAVGENITITASFEGNETYKANSVSYTLNIGSSIQKGNISFNCDEATNGCPESSLLNQTSLPNPLPIVTKEGKNFGGWFTDNTFETPAEAGASISADVTLYAKWLEPYTVSEALAIIAELEDNGQTANSVYVSGIVSTAPTSNPSSGKLTFYISANGEAENELQAYNCKNLNNTNFTAKTDIQIMDEVIIYGPLKKYMKNTVAVPEFNTGYLYSFSRKQEAGLAWDPADDIVLTVGDEFSAPSLLNPNEIDANEIAISTTNGELTEILNGVVSLVPNKTGEATITATFAGNSTYKAAEVSYMITVNAAPIHGSITYVVNGGSDVDNIADATNLPDPLPEPTRDGYIFAGWFTDDNTFENAAVAGAALEGDITLYAKWTEIPVWARTYTSNITNSAPDSKVIPEDDQEYDAWKIGKGGNITLTVPAGTAALHFHLVAWNGEAATIIISGTCFTTSKEISAVANAGIANNSPFTLQGVGVKGSDFYYSVTPDNAITENTVITFTTASNKRAVVFGVNAIYPEITLDPVSFDFGNVRANATKEQVFTITANDNVSGTLSASITDYANGKYRVSAISDNKVTVTFDPDGAEEGTFTAKLLVEASNASVTANLSGTAISAAAPMIVTDKSSIAFGRIEPNTEVSATVAVDLQNIDENGVSATLSGDDAAKFGLSATIFTEDGVLTITPNTSENGIFAATLTLSAEGAEDVVLPITMTVASKWAATYTSNVKNLSSDENKKVKVGADNTEYNLVKANKGSNATFKVPRGTQKIHVHMVAWSGEGQNVTISGPGCFASSKVETITDNENLSGASWSPLELEEAEAISYYYELTPDVIPSTETTITITAASGKRFAIFGVNQEGGIVEISDDTNASTLEDNANIEVKNGATLTVDADKQFGDLTAEAGSVIDLTGGGTITTTNFIIHATNTSSNQVIGATNGVSSNIQSENIYFEKDFVEAGHHWYNVAVPFNVDINGGIQTADGRELEWDTHFNFYYYDGANRALNGKGNNWIEETNQLQPGVNYQCVFDQAYGAIRFKKAAGANINNGANITANAYGIDTDPSNTNAGWNGIANNGLAYAQATLTGVTFIQVLNADGTAYEPQVLQGFVLIVGMPFFVQGAGTFSFLNPNDGNTPLYAPQRVNGTDGPIAVELKKNGKRVDRLYVTASEDAIPAYQIGKDVVKFTSNNAAQLWVNNYNEKLCANDAQLVNNQAVYDLGLYAPAAGTYSISAQQVEGATLYVTYNGAIVWNLSLGDYEMDLVRGTTTGYGLLLVAQPNQMPTGVENGELLNGENGVQKILLNGQLYILRDGHLYDAVGKEMK